MVGFADPVADAQRTFRATLQAMSRPTLPVALEVGALGPASLTGPAAALVLTLFDDSTAVWLDGSLRNDAELSNWISFHTAAKIVDDPAASDFALVASSQAIPALNSFGIGTDEAPHTSTTVVAMIDGRGEHTTVVAEGPGFPAPATWDAPFPHDLVAEWARNGLLFPRGVDLLLAGDQHIVALPRTTRLRLPIGASNDGTS